MEFHGWAFHWMISTNILCRHAWSNFVRRVCQPKNEEIREVFLHCLSARSFVLPVRSASENNCRRNHTLDHNYRLLVSSARKMPPEHDNEKKTSFIAHVDHGIFFDARVAGSKASNLFSAWMCRRNKWQIFFHCRSRNVDHLCFALFLTIDIVNGVGLRID